MKVALRCWNLFSTLLRREISDDFRTLRERDYRFYYCSTVTECCLTTWVFIFNLFSSCLYNEGCGTHCNGLAAKMKAPNEEQSEKIVPPSLSSSSEGSSYRTLLLVGFSFACPLFEGLESSNSNSLNAHFPLSFMITWNVDPPRLFESHQYAFNTFTGHHNTTGDLVWPFHLKTVTYS